MQQPERHEVQTSVLVNRFEWPPFFEPDEVSFLARRVHEAARGEQERKQFLAILDRAREDVLELEILYRDLPGVISGDRDSTENFRTVLDQSLTRGADAVGQRWLDRTRLETPPESGLDGSLPCDPRFLLKPDRISLLIRGLLQISGRNRGLYDRYAAVLAGLWQQSAALELLYQQALRGLEANGRDRLTETLGLMSREMGFREPMSPPAESVPPYPVPVDIIASRMSDPADAGDRWPDPAPRSIALRFALPINYLPLDFCGRVFDTCRYAPFGTGGRLADLPSSTNQNGIRSVSPNLACPFETLTISGGFGNTQPTNVNVVIGSVVAPVVSWTPTTIVVTAPAGAYEGCVAFRDENIEAQRQGAFNAHIEARERLNDTLQCLGKNVRWSSLPYDASPPPVCLAATRVHVGPPIVDKFLANGASTLTVDPGALITLTWQVRGATTLRIRRTSAGGPPINMPFDLMNPSVTQRSLGPFTGTQPADGVYELIAANRCGTTTRTVTVRLRKTPALRILGIEITQAIQRFDLMNPAQNNTVRLVAGKRTMVRVYVDSGIMDNFDSGAGPNHQPNVTGSITIPSTGAGQGFAGLLNASRSITARPSSEIDRMSLDHTLNFELPVNRLSGIVTMNIQAWVENATGAGWSHSITAGARFRQRRTKTLLRIRVRDDDPSRMLAAPTQSDFNNVLATARRMYPVSETGFLIGYPPGFEEISTNDCAGTFSGPCDLTVESEWDRLLNHLEWIAGQFPGSDQIWAAVVPSTPAYPSIVGKARPPQAGVRLFASVIEPWPFGHELGHTFGLLHAGSSTEDPDPRLPLFIGEVGTDVPGRRLFAPTLTLEIMFELNSDPVWFSIASWDIIFDDLA